MWNVKLHISEQNFLNTIEEYYISGKGKKLTSILVSDYMRNIEKEEVNHYLLIELLFFPILSP